VLRKRTHSYGISLPLPQIFSFQCSIGSISWIRNRIPPGIDITNVLCAKEVHTEVLPNSGAYPIKSTSHSIPIGPQWPPRLSYDRTSIIESRKFSDLIESIDFFTDTPQRSCILSYFVRAEATVHLDQALQLVDDAITKELSASQAGDRPSTLNYQAFFTHCTTPNIHSIPKRMDHVVALWRGGFERFRSTVEYQYHLYLPTYQSHKNVSYATQWNLMIAQHTSTDSPPNISQRDLIRHYHVTGEKIQGPMEMRWAWRYNDLKPRVYYCGGGDALWPCLYIKPIIKDLLRT
jgi:hypothetical protein